VLSAEEEMARRGGRLEEIVLVLTSACNLRCRYCYQNAKQARAMPWPVLRAGLDLLFGLSRAAVVLSFSGGEPTLEFGSIRRAVEYAGGRAVTCHVTTNGLLLGPPELAFLAEHDFLVDLSTDGVAPSQDLRQAGSFDAIEELLDRWRHDHPGHFARRCRVAMTLTRTGIPHLADSLEHFLSKRVPEILLQAAMIDAPWADDDLAELERQLARARALAVTHLRATGEIPFSVFRGTSSRTRAPYARRWGCRAPLGRALTVDVDGTVYACALAARSYQRFEDPGFERRLSRLVLGDVHDPELGRRLAALPAAAADSGIFGPKRTQHVGGRHCASCRHRAACFVCPIVRARQACIGDIDAVPERLCAFNRALARHGRVFRRQQGVGGPDRLSTWLFERPRATT
jgi:sulfatase maturation enzyme AslB (radical SAM superfamily)